MYIVVNHDTSIKLLFVISSESIAMSTMPSSWWSRLKYKLFSAEAAALRRKRLYRHPSRPILCVIPR